VIIHFSFKKAQAYNTKNKRKLQKADKKMPELKNSGNKDVRDLLWTERITF